MGFRAEGLGLRAWGLGFRVQFRVFGLGAGAQGVQRHNCVCGFAARCLTPLYLLLALKSQPKNKSSASFMDDGTSSCSCS